LYHTFFKSEKMASAYFETLKIDLSGFKTLCIVQLDCD
jgi:hypothetical protein